MYNVRELVGCKLVSLWSLAALPWRPSSSTLNLARVLKNVALGSFSERAFHRIDIKFIQSFTVNNINQVMDKPVHRDNPTVTPPVL